MWIEIIFIKYISWRIFTMFDIANILETIGVKDVPKMIMSF